MTQRSTTAPKVTAVLGPTNTGKTFFAIERMLAHRSGMIGLPLRLLAREVYDRIVRLKGLNEIALITGEEKIVPKSARFYVCTVEAMPLEIAVACLVVDEIQLAADPERGHIFTDRLLHARGQEETMFLGAESMRGTIQRFIPKAWFITRPRFSDLAYTGAKKLTRLPRRSAVVGFSAQDVYGIAEIVRRQRGGAAVVLGALSPRTRNAQVALYQSGEVDFLVATDAIGMGLNMDVDHVAFAGAEKFDGRGFRPLTPAEIGQIAGRAGRYMNDGTFGVTGECEPFDEEMVSRVESHRYDAVKVLQWRNSALAFHSLPALLESLDAPPPERGLARARPASDAVALHHLSNDAEVLARATSRDNVRRLWEVCQLPDFRKLSADDHTRMVRTLFLFLMGEQGRIPDDWMARQIARLDIAEGDVATLSGRLAQIRTFTYAAHRPGWTRDGSHWQNETRAVEDRLSDALHERLTQRFIDRRASILMKHLSEDEIADVTLEEDGGVLIGGELIGRLDGFRFTPDPRTERDGTGMLQSRMMRTAAMRGLEGEFLARARALAAAPDSAITLSEHGKLWWDGAIVGHLTAGPSPLALQINLIADELLKGASRAAVETRLSTWLAADMEKRIEPLLALARAAETRAGSELALPATARGFAHQLAENFGSLDRDGLAMPEKLGPVLRALKPFGVWFGRRTIYLPRLLRPDAAGLLALLWSVWTKVSQLTGPPAPGLTSFAHDGEPREFLHAAGFQLAGGRAIRFDMLERLEEELDKADRMFVAREVARPTVCDERGLRRMGRRRASRIGRRAVQQNSKIYVGLDTSKLKISVAVAEEGRDGEVRFIGDIDSAPDVVERLVTKLAKRHRQLAFCYEAGPTGYGLHRQITQLGHECIVVAPSLIPKRSGERVKTNRRDALTLAKMHRAGELTAVWVPDPGHEAVRELVRAREAAMEDLRRTRQHLQSFLLRHGRVFTGRSAWTKAHTRWLCEQSFDHRAQYLVLTEYRQAIENAETRLKHLTGQVVEVVASWSMAPVVAAYQALRGVAFLTAVTFVAEIGDVRRFDSPRQLMAYLGLVPSENSTGERVWRGKITKAGNSRARRVLIEGAWTYRFPARMSRLLQERQAGLTKVVRDIAWKAQLRLCSRYRKLMARGKRQTVVTVAIAREMSAFLWAIGQEVEPHPVA